VIVAVFGGVPGRVLPGGVNPWGSPPGVVVAVFGPVVGRVLPGAINPWAGPPGVAVGRALPGEVKPGDGPPGAPGRGASVAGLPRVVAPGSAAVWIGAGGGGAGGGALSAPLLTRVTTAPGNAVLTGAAPPPAR
jgi:hypothetical protein